MRAIVMKEYGGPECLVPAERPDPVAKPGWAVVRLRTAALNWHDVLVRQGRYQSPLPHVPGADGAGTDAETGEDVLVMPSLWWGDGESAPGPSWEILGDHRPGTYAEMVRVPRECVVPKPARLSWPEAAALPLVGLTTYRALFPRARLVRGESLLVLGAGGGVATMAVSLASAVGCTVVVTSSSPHKVSRSRELGASGGPLRRPVVAAGGAGAVTRRARLRRRPRLDRDLAAVDRRAAPGRAARRPGSLPRRAGKPRRAALLLRPVRPARHHHGEYP